VPACTILLPSTVRAPDSTTATRTNAARRACRGALALAATLCVAGCAAPGLTAHAPSAAAAITRHRATASSPIQHVVIIIQENRSFDDLFQGYPGANTVPAGLDHEGNLVQLQPVSLAAPYDVLHGLGSFTKAYDGGKLDGFDREHVTHRPANDPDPQYGYVPASEIGPYLALAQQYVLSDATFSSQLDGSFTAHQYLIAAQAMHAVNFPSGGWGCPSGEVGTLLPSRMPGPREPACFGTSDPASYPTLGDELDAAGLPWRFYAPAIGTSGALWSAYHAVKHVYGRTDWNDDVISPQTNILTDAPGGTLAAVTWVVPDVHDSDHANSKSTTGPQWVANVVNAIGESPFWSSSVIFVIWGDWGGWYDHVPPPQLDYDGLGFRVPLLCISPYAKQNYVSHVQLESASVLRYVEDNFGLNQLAAADARATDAGSDCLNPSQRARKFTPIATALRAPYFIHRRRSLRAPDDE
jgi:phospholipase C